MRQKARKKKSMFWSRMTRQGPFIDAAIGVIQRRIATLENRWKAYQKASTATKAVATQIYVTKLKMAADVAAAEAKITAAKDELGPQIQAAKAAGNGPLATQLETELVGRITAAITQAQDEVAIDSAAGAGEVAAQDAAILGWHSHLSCGAIRCSNTDVSAGSPELVVVCPPPPPPPAVAPKTPAMTPSRAPADGDGSVRLSDALTPASSNSTNSGSQDASDNRLSPKVKPAAATNGTSTPPPSSATSAPSSPLGSSGSSGGSVIGQLMKPISSGGSSPGSMMSPASAGAGMVWVIRRDESCWRAKSGSVPRR